MRALCILSLALLAMTACSTGSPDDDFDPDSAATNHELPYTGTLPDAAASEDTIRCPNAFPTGGSTESDHQGVGPFFCSY
jgi:hypothetical protein